MASIEPIFGWPSPSSGLTRWAGLADARGAHAISLQLIAALGGGWGGVTEPAE